MERVGSVSIKVVSPWSKNQAWEEYCLKITGDFSDNSRELRLVAGFSCYTKKLQVLIEESMTEPVRESTSALVLNSSLAKCQGDAYMHKVNAFVLERLLPIP